MGYNRVHFVFRIAKTVVLTTWVLTSSCWQERRPAEALTGVSASRL
jgi:hypothetical protein